MINHITIIIIIIIIYLYAYINLRAKKTELIKEYSKIQSELNLNYTNNINNEIRIGIYTVSLSDGGLQRITSQLINHLAKKKLIKYINKK